MLLSYLLLRHRYRESEGNIHINVFPSWILLIVWLDLDPRFGLHDTIMSLLRFESSACFRSFLRYFRGLHNIASHNFVPLLICSYINRRPFVENDTYVPLIQWVLCIVELEHIPKSLTEFHHIDVQLNSMKSNLSNSDVFSSLSSSSKIVTYRYN